MYYTSGYVHFPACSSLQVCVLIIATVHLVLAIVLSALHAPSPLIATVILLKRYYDPPFSDEK